MTASVIGAPAFIILVVIPSLMSMGSAERLKAVPWAKAREIVTLWLLTIITPGTRILSVMTFPVLDLLVPGR